MKFGEAIDYAGCELTDEEKEYIANDVLVVKEALEGWLASQADMLANDWIVRE